MKIIIWHVYITGTYFKTDHNSENFPSASSPQTTTQNSNVDKRKSRLYKYGEKISFTPKYSTTVKPEMMSYFEIGPKNKEKMKIDNESRKRIERKPLHNIITLRSAIIVEWFLFPHSTIFAV